MKKILVSIWFFSIVLAAATGYTANDFYTPSGAPATGASLSSATLRAEFNSIEDGFDKFPALSGNSELPVFINTGETGLEAVSAATALIRLGGENSTNKDASGGYTGLTLYKINFLNAAGTFTSFLANSNTAARTYTFPDSTGTVALTTDAPAAHTVASHSDTTATGAELETLTDDSMADALHRHSELSASDGSPNPALSFDGAGAGTIASGGTLTFADGGAAVDEYSTDGTLAGNSDTAIPTEKAVKTYVDANAGVVKGQVTRAKFEYSTTSAIKIGAGSYHHKGTTEQYVYWSSQLTYTFSALGSSDWSFLYIDDSAVVTAGTNLLTASEFIDSTTAPTYSQANHGWYNGSDRCIFAVLTNGSSNILKFYNIGGDGIIYDNAIADASAITPGTTWTDVTLSIPDIATAAMITSMITVVDVSEGHVWRVNGSSGTGHYTGGISGGTSRVVTDSSQIVEVKWPTSNTNQLTVYTDGWVFPEGM